MSQKIDDVLHVLKAIRRNFHADRKGSLRQARIDAIHAIADGRGVTYQTIGDAYLRRLEPDIRGTPAFDRVTEDWLTRKSDTLLRILEKHAIDSQDRANIEDFFV